MQRFANVPAGTKPGNIEPVLLSVRGAENDHRHLTAPVTLPHALQDLGSRPLWKIQIDDHEVRTINLRPSVKSPDEVYGLIAVGGYNQLALDAMLFKRFTDQIHIGRVVLDYKNRTCVRAAS